MQRIHLHTPVNEKHLKLPTGTYLMTEPMAEAVIAEGLGTVEPLGCLTGPIDEESFFHEGGLILMTPGAYGDMLFLTPILAAIHRQWPEKQLFVSCFPEYWDALKGVADYVGVLNYPLLAGDVDREDRVIEIIGAITMRPDMHAVDAQAEAIGYKWRDGDSKECVYTVTRRETMEASMRYPRISGRPRVGVQVRSSSPNRDYPGAMLAQVLESLLDYSWDIVLFGSPGQAPIPKILEEYITNLTTVTPAPTFAESAAILSTCDVVLAPDSAIAHLGGALRIPTVALYGPIDHEVRTAYADSIVALQGHAVAGCSPCGFHPAPGEIWPRKINGRTPPCFYSNKCEALAEIPPGRVVQEVERALALVREEVRS